MKFPSEAVKLVCVKGWSLKISRISKAYQNNLKRKCMANASNSGSSVIKESSKRSILEIIVESETAH